MRRQDDERRRPTEGVGIGMRRRPKNKTIKTKHYFLQKQLIGENLPFRILVWRIGQSPEKKLTVFKNELFTFRLFIMI